MSILQELLEIRSELLTERVDNMLDRLRTHFSKKENPDPAKMFSSEDIQVLATQLAGLEFIFTDSGYTKKVPELGQARTIMQLFAELDEPRQRQLFNDRSMTAEEFLSFIGKKHNNSSTKKLLKHLEELKAHKNINANSEAIARFVSALEQKLVKFKESVK